MKVTDLITITNEDNMQLMARYPDNYFDLAIVDPPYGIGENGDKNHSRCKLAKAKNYKSFAGGDKSIPDESYFKELMRVSKNQIIWGGNYMINHLHNTSCFIVWDKNNGSSDFADCELAWTNFKSAVRKYKFTWNGMLQENMKNKEVRIHPTQKPVKLYEWLLDNYAKEGDKILDTHLGSGSIAIAAHNRKFELVACELDKEYFDNAIKRIKNHTNQMTIFDVI